MAKKGLEKRRYGRSRRRRRQGALLLIVLLLALSALPFLLKVPETVRRITYPLKYEETIRAAAAAYGVEPTLIAAVIRTESRFDPEVESSQGAYGLMQLRPETARFISERGGVGGDYRYPKTNIRMGTWYLGYLQYRYGGDERLVLAAYNSGESQVDAWISDEGFDVARDIPFKETRDYVENVLEARNIYAELYGKNLDRRA
ncbi:MAG: lytic transglycosylase domain-containing protein [Actinomycetota bacterium]|nr:lytic transglycosylase domain-containing protein [Actinomycetota bacterium]